MVAIVRTEWSGTSGGPGLTQFAVLGAAGGIWNPSGTQAAVNAVRTFWDSQKANLPDEVRLRISPVVDDYDTATGDLVGSYVAGTAPLDIVGTSVGGYAGGAGLKITWNTNQIRNGRRVRGNTFIVPITNAIFTSGGTIGTSFQTSVNSSAATLISQLTAGGTSLAVWSRPRTGDNPRAGYATEVLTGTCSAKTAILRGRRD
jgi:hypothetical protein